MRSLGRLLKRGSTLRSKQSSKYSPRKRKGGAPTQSATLFKLGTTLPGKDGLYQVRKSGSSRRWVKRREGLSLDRQVKRSNGVRRGGHAAASALVDAFSLHTVRPGSPVVPQLFPSLYRAGQFPPSSHPNTGESQNEAATAVNTRGLEGLRQLYDVLIELEGVDNSEFVLSFNDRTTVRIKYIRMISPSRSSGFNSETVTELVRPTLPTWRIPLITEIRKIS